jgi:hypothetical protein
MTTESSDTSKQPAKPLLGIRLRLMLLALLAVVPLTLDRVRVLEAGRSERIDRAAAEMMELARRGAEQQNEMVVTVRALIQAAALLCDRVGTTRGSQCTALLSSRTSPGSAACRLSVRTEESAVPPSPGLSASTLATAAISARH